jgi:DUF4097 and DUF4098 domain-containing protein YvlB
MNTSSLKSLFIAASCGLAFAAQADAQVWDASRPTPLSSELAGQISREVQRAMAEFDLKHLDALQSAEALKQLRELAALNELDAHALRPLLLDSEDAVGGGHDNDRDGGDAAGPVIDEHRPLTAEGRIYINNTAGNIDVSTWDRNEVAITGTLGGSAERLDINGDPAALNVVVRLPKHSFHAGETILKLRVPSNARVDLDTVSADVAVDGARGAVKVNTVSGDIGLVVNSPEVTVQTVSGDLRLRAPAKLTKVNSVSGDLRMAGLQGKLSVETVSGNVELDGGKFSELRLKSISGDLRLDVAFADAAEVVGETLSGEINMRVPSGLTGTALLKSFSGETRCDGASFENARSSRKREYVWGDGKGARIELSSFSGDIHVERK